MIDTENPFYILLQQDEVEHLSARTAAITYLNTERQKHLEEAQRAEVMAHFIQEDMTLWLRAVHNLGDTDQWHLDLETKCLRKVERE